MMKKIWMIFILAFIVVNAIAFTVFFTGNGQQVAKPTNSTNQQSQTGNQQNTNPQQNNPPSNTPSEKTVTASELSTHDTQGDCWIAYQGKVYDLTSFLPKHPGSAGAITPYCGTSEEFENAFKDQHGTSQVQKMIKESVYKGELE